MSSSIRQVFGYNLARTILEEIQFQRSRYYYTLGNIEPWNIQNGIFVDDNVPSTPILESEEINSKIRSEIVFAKLISPNEAGLVIRKIVWQSGEAYDQWDHTIDMRAKNFYVVNTTNRVYKCLYNNTSFGAANITPSTVEPTSTSVYPFTTSDGYVWKYMYTLSNFANRNFGSFVYMPVQRALSNSFYNNGAVDDVIVLTQGSGYTDSPQTTISISGGTTGSGAAATFETNAYGQITNITIVNGGSGYTKGVRLSITSAQGAGAEIEPVIVAGVITDITIINSGINYDSDIDTINFDLGGAVLVPSVSAETGSITKVTILDAGVGYITAPTLLVIGAGGTGLYGNSTALLSAIEYEGQIVQVNILDPGQDYPTDNDTQIVVQGDGTGAKFTPVIFDGKVIDVITENAGVGYENIILTVVGNGSGATLTAVITQSDYESDQLVVEQAAVDGAIYAINVSSGGENYSSQTTVTIEGNGVGCIATPFIEFGIIKKIEITESGSGYTWANVVITDPNREIEIIPLNERASAYAILPPIGGHGKDAPTELFSDTIAINTSLRNDFQIQNIIQDFRTYSILKNPTDLFTGGNYTVPSSLLAYTVELESGTDITNLRKDDVLILNNNKYRVIDFDSSFMVLTPLDKQNIIPIGTLLSFIDNTREYKTIRLISSFSMNKYSGALLFVSQENPFEFSENQSITVKTFIKF